MWWETHRDAEERSEGELCRVLTRDAPTEEEVAVRYPFAETDKSEGALTSRGARYCQVDPCLVPKQIGQLSSQHDSRQPTFLTLTHPEAW